MTADAPATAVRWNTRRIVLLGVGAGVLLLVLANAHLVYVAVSSDSGCVPHTKQVGTASGSEASYRAAQSAC